MASPAKIKIGILGASGYTGAELLRFLIPHPRVEIMLLTADRKAGAEMSDVFPQFVGYNLPKLVGLDGLDWAALNLDLIFCALPHGTTQNIIASILQAAPATRIVDLSADFRLSDGASYAKWYGHEHQALDLQKEAIYGLVEVYRRDIKKARLVANPGCHTTTGLLPLIPLLRAKLIETDPIIINNMTGVSGAGRAAKEGSLFTEVAEGIHPYGIANHRHTSEFDQELSKAAKREVICSFTPHLVPMSRGINATINVMCKKGKTAADLQKALADFYAGEYFVKVLPLGQTPQTRHVRGSNRAIMGVVADRIEGRAIIVSAIDNLVKGASGQAVQNMNLMMGWPESLGLEAVSLFP